MTVHPASVPGWVCESCRPPAVDCPCSSWRCSCGCQRLDPGHDLGPLVRRADELVEQVQHLVAVDRVGCRRCGTPLDPVDVGFDEDANAVVAVAECRVCGWERPQSTFTGPELREWVARRQALVKQRRGSR